LALSVNKSTTYRKEARKTNIAMKLEMKLHNTTVKVTILSVPTKQKITQQE
jgi:hypothetical protein